MKTLGVDLAADPKRTGACLVDWQAPEVRLFPAPSDDLLVDEIAKSDKTGIDVPLGWPDAFVEAVVAHHHGVWPRTDPSRRPLRYRLTDEATRQADLVVDDSKAIDPARRIQPLSVSSDLIGVAAMRGALLQRLLADRNVDVDRSGMRGAIAETYPAGALVAWSLPSLRYKGSHKAALPALVARLTARCGPLAEAAQAALRDCDDHAFDAFVCAIVARAVLLGLTTAPNRGQQDQAQREGWIHVPIVSLEAVIAGS